MSVDKPGATGEFPRGKLNAEDEGELAIGLAVKDGTVLIHFGKPVAWLGLDPQAAASLAGKLIRHARHAAKERGVALDLGL